MIQNNSIVRKSLVDQVYDLLLERIQMGVLTPGDRLNIEDLSKEFGVSRTPLREAIGKLQEAGLVEVIHNVGPSVAYVSAEMAKEIIEANAILINSITDLVFMTADYESLADALDQIVDDQEDALRKGEDKIFARASVAFHEKFIESCPNKMLKEITLGTQIRLDALVLSYLEWNSKREESIREHRLLARCVRQGKREDFKRLMNSHNMTPLNYFKRDSSDADLINKR